SPKSFPVAPISSVDDVVEGADRPDRPSAPVGGAQSAGTTARSLKAQSASATARSLKAQSASATARSLKDRPHLQLLRRAGRVDRTRLQAYRADGGYAALKRAFELRPEGVIQEVLASNLMGRGGAAFPTGRKWDAVSKAPARPHYVVCNADESEPGTFKDRIVMESDPFAIIEGMTIAAYATGSDRGFFYIRGEYPLAAESVGAAIRAARQAGLLGANIFRSKFSFGLEVR